MVHDPLSWEDAVRWLLDQPDRQELARAAYFDLPTKNAARRYHQSAEFAALRAFLPSRPGRALDLGAGNGILSYALAADGWTVTAVEPDPSDMVGAGAIRRLSSDTGVPIDVIEAFGEAIPLEGAGYDLVIARQVLHHAHDLPQLCREMARLARPGGQIITLRDHVISGPEQMRPFLDAHPLHHLYGGENAFTLDEYRRALCRAGLVVDKTLKSFDSVINYAPLTEREIRGAASDPLPGFLKPVARLVAGITPFALLCRLATAVDRRPGRLVSFVAGKPPGPADRP
jgi:SAM-dependent methyltransferase